MFDTFVIASSNRFAHAAAQSVAETPARSYNPLFIYGDAGWARPTCSTPSGTTSARTSRGRHVRYVTTETFMNDFVDAIRTNDHHRLQAPLPRVRRPAHRRRPVHGEQGGPPGGVLPHLQLPLRGLQADRPDLGPTAQVDRHPRGPAPQPLPLGSDHRGPAARARDPPGHPPDQGRARAGRRPRRRPRVHRHPREGQHPGARGRPHPGHRLRQPQPGADLAGSWPSGCSPTSSRPTSPAGSPPR